MICDTTFTARGDVDPRVAELQEVIAGEGFHFHLSVSAVIDMVLWFEDRGYVIDLLTGIAASVELVGPVAITPSGKAVNHLLSPVTDDEVEETINGLFAEGDDTLDALIAEVDCKPGLGVEDSAGLFDDADPVMDGYWMGYGDQSAGCYNPPRDCIEAHDAYIRGHNDAWAKAQKVQWWRRQ